MKVASITALLAVFTYHVSAVDLDLDDATSVHNALSLIAQGLMDYYDGYRYGGTIGEMVEPYYWWEAGAAWNALIDRWVITGNTTYNDVVYESLLYQTGTNRDYMPANQTTVQGNDDQGFWGIAAMAAAERNFTNPPSDQAQWLYLAQAVFNEMVGRWDSADCDGGLRWQIYTWNSGYDYKNTVSTGCMFNLAARLARYTGNSTYTDWAKKIWTWFEDVGFITSDYYVNDGANIVDNECPNPTAYRWSYNYGLMISGSAFMYEYTNDSTWLDHVTGLWKVSEAIFFNSTNKVIYESACQNAGTCNNDQRCFRGIFAGFLGLTMQLLADETELVDEMLTYLNASAKAAALSCSGGTDGHTCGLNWFPMAWDGMYGLGEQISALAVIQNTQIWNTSKPLSSRTGASSQGSGDAGSSTTVNLISDTLTITNKDRAGAIVVTVVVLASMLFGGVWMIKEPGLPWGKGAL